MEAAFKEWNVVVDALGRGDQIVIMRKGGIDEGENGFEIKHKQFWLFPTRFHQQKEFVIPAAADYVNISPNHEMMPIQYHCEVMAHIELTSLDQIDRIQGQHIRKDEVLIQRMTSGECHQLHALLVRTSMLAEPVMIPNRSEYGGCKSWIELRESFDANHLKPVLDDPSFEKKLQKFKESIQ